MAEQSKNTFVRHFIHPLRNSANRSNLCIRHSIYSPNTQQILRLSICTSLILDLSISLHVIVSLSYSRKDTSNAPCNTLASHTEAEDPLTLTRDLIASATSSPSSPSLKTSLPYSPKTNLKYLNFDTCSSRTPSTRISRSNPSSPT